MTIEYRIYPPIGIARVGNSTTEFCYGPETYLGLPTEEQDGNEVPIDSFRDDQQRVKRQAARFYIYAYDTDQPNTPGKRVSIGSDDIADITWRVHLANKKAEWYTFEQLEGEVNYNNHPRRNPEVENRHQLIIDPGPVSVSGANATADFARGKAQAGYQQFFPPEKLQPESIDYLGELRTDGAGNLVVLGGLGHSGSDKPPKITKYANNDNWWDDISDGPVTASVTLSSGAVIDVTAKSWVVVAPPAYAPQIPNVVNLYDVMYEVALTHFNSQPELYQNGSYQETYLPSFKDDIEPLLQRPTLAQWVCKIPENAHLFDFGLLGDPDPKHNKLRQSLFENLRRRDQPNQKGTQTIEALMPLLCGDNPITDTIVSKYLSLTETQYFMLEQWSKGKFIAESHPSQPSPEDAIGKHILQNCVGGPFCPGIEITWIARNPALFDAPFRIRHGAVQQGRLSLDEDISTGMEPGDVSKRMALPWQADFNECSTQGIKTDTNETDDVLWWPAQRPMQVIVKQPVKGLGGNPPAAWARGIPGHGDTPGDLGMVSQWKNLGFVKKFPDRFLNRYLEVERNDEAFDEPKLS